MEQSHLVLLVWGARERLPQCVDRTYGVGDLAIRRRAGKNNGHAEECEDEEAAANGFSECTHMIDTDIERERDGEDGLHMVDQFGDLLLLHWC